MPRAYKEFSQCCYWWHLQLLTKCWDFPSLVFFFPLLFLYHSVCFCFIFCYTIYFPSPLQPLLWPLSQCSITPRFSLWSSSLHWEIPPIPSTGKFDPLDFNCHFYAGISQLCVPALTFWDIFLTPTTNSLILQIPSGYPTIQFNSGTNDPQLDPIS